MKLFKLFIICALCFGSMSAGEVLTLDQCRELALRHNIEIRNSELRSEAAREVRREAFTKYFPQITATGMAFRTNRDALSIKKSGELPIPAIPELLPQGGALPYSFEFGLIRKGFSVGVGAVQPVFIGGEIINGNRLAEVGEAVAELQSRQSADQVRLTVEQYYWQLATLKAKRRTLDNVIALLDTLERQVSVAVNAGVVLRNDLLEVQLRQNEMKTARLELDNGISIISILLGQYIGMGVEPVDIDADIAYTVSPVSPDDYFINPIDALYATTDYQLLHQSVKAADLEKRIAVGKNLPKVGIGAMYSYNGLDDDQHGFGAIFAAVAIPISDWWGGSHSIKQSNLKLQMARNRLSDDSELLQVKMMNAWNDLNTSFDKISVARLSIDQATENLRINENCYRAGTVTINDLLKAQTLYRQSHDQFVDAYGEYQIRTTEYLQATGR